MTTYTIVFPHKEHIPITVQHGNGATCLMSLEQVLRLVRHGCDKPRLVQLPDGIALEVTVRKGDN